MERDLIANAVPLVSVGAEPVVAAAGTHSHEAVRQREDLLISGAVDDLISIGNPVKAVCRGACETIDRIGDVALVAAYERPAPLVPVRDGVAHLPVNAVIRLPGERLGAKRVRVVLAGHDLTGDDHAGGARGGGHELRPIEDRKI